MAFTAGLAVAVGGERHWSTPGRKNWLAGLQCQDADASLENKKITINTLMAFGVEMFWISGDTSLNLNQTGGCSFPGFLSPT